ncbi:MAG: ABC transporter permease, partial [Saccharofermentans sp.]|nr:ABC transporter permease [Saccharofermentans sp.]
QNSNEAVLVLTSNGAVSDYIIYAFGLRDAAELDKMVRDFSNGIEVVSDQEYYTWHYEDFMGKTFKVVPAYEFYKYDGKQKVYTDMRNSNDYMRSLLKKSQDLKIVGIIQPKENQDILMLNSGIYYGKDLKEELRAKAEDADIVKKQLADREVNVLTGERFDEQESNFKMDDLFSIDEDAIRDAFKFDEDKLKFDKDAFGDMSGIDFAGALKGSMPSLSEDQLKSILKGVDFKVNTEKLLKGMGDIFNDYMDYAKDDPSTDYAKLPDAMAAFISSSEGSAVLRQQLIKLINDSGISDIDPQLANKALTAITDGFAEYALANGMDLSDQSRYPEYYRTYLASAEGKKILDEQSAMISKEITDKVKITPKQAQGVAQALLDAYSEHASENNLPDPKALEGSLKKYLGSDRAKKIITETITGSVNIDEITKTVAKNVNGMTSKMASQLGKGIEKAIKMVVERIASNMTKALKDTFSDFGSALSVDQDAFAKAFQFNMGEDEMKSFMSELMGGSIASAEGNLSAFGYCDAEDLQSITIFPKDFESKDQITTIIKDYNKMVEDRGEDDKSITYTDIVGALMKSVTKIINTISYVLIAFVAISLVVSSIMIGVITYISVLERRKEIGILRAMGASKRNVADVFNAETMITGFLAGLFGVGISLFSLIPINSLIHKLAESNEVSAAMPWAAAVILILLSVVLTLIGGLIPSKTASRQDPVTALRTE